MSTRALMGLGALLLTLAACQSESSPSILLNDPTATIRVMGVPEPWSFQSLGLAFQRAEFDRDDLERTRPIGDGFVTDQGSLYLSFPNHNAILFVADKHADLQFYGAEALGGDGLDLGSPDWVQVTQAGIFCGRSGSPIVQQFSENGLMGSQVFDGTSVVGNDRDGFWVQSPERMDLSLDAKIVRRIKKPEHVDLVTGTVASAVVASSKEGVFWLISGDKPLLKSWRLGAAITQIFDLALDEQGRIWLLVEDSRVGHVLVVIDSLGTLRHHYKVPFEADRLALASNAILLIEQEAGAAQIYQR